MIYPSSPSTTGFIPPARPEPTIACRGKLICFALKALVLVFCACPGSHPPDHSSISLTGPDTLEINNSPDAFFLKKYIGQIGERPVEMVLLNWGDGYLSGRYWQKDPKKFRELSGELKTGNQFKIFELIEGRETGVFIGNLEDPTRLTGQWESLTGQMPQNFFLTEEKINEKQTQWNGNWYLNGVWDSGWIMIGNVEQDSFDFAISIVRGSHSGIVEGRASWNKNLAVFNRRIFEEQPCLITFERRGDTLYVQQGSSNLICGVGAKATLSGIYIRKKLIIRTILPVGSGEFDVFVSQNLHDEFLRLTGAKTYFQFAYNMQVRQKTTSSRGEIIVTGMIPGLIGSNEAIIMYHPNTSRIYAATTDQHETDQRDIIRYFTNDPGKIKELPPEIEEWCSDKSKLPVVFQSASPDM